MTLIMAGKEGGLELPPETLSFFNNDELRARVFYEKYALKDEAGNTVEKTPLQMWRRVAREIASVEREEKRKEWEDNFYWLLEDFRFVPGGRILFGTGQSRRSTLLNCYFIPIHEDSLEAIFNWCREAARTYSFGGGVGTDISLLRPRGSPVNNSAIYSTGAVSFMELMSVTTGTIGQAGRRGALMITIRVDHPDILDFINVKRDLSKVNYANISVLITDAFMEAVEKDEDFELRFSNEKAVVRKNVRAREIWDQLVKAAWESAEPGLIFWDKVKIGSPSEYNGVEVKGFNPCSEQCLEDYGCCCLGNINLSSFVLDEFTEKARIDWDGLQRALRYAVRFLDNILDYNADRHPLLPQKDASLWSRRIGVGFTGLGDMLVKLRLKYDEESTIAFADGLFSRIKNVVYEASSDFAAEKGSFPAFELEKHLQRPFVQRLDKEVLDKVVGQGLRNVCLLTVPPVGSGAILAGCTSGVEPIYDLSYLRRSKSLSGGEFKVYHPLVKAYMKRFGIEEEKELPGSFITAHKIRPGLRVHMQATIQKHIDSSISSTVNLPADITVEEVGKIYFLAWRLGCKGITVYRENSREGILVTEKGQKMEKQIQEKGLNSSTVASDEAHVYQKQIKEESFDRPRVLSGQTIRFRLPQGSLYVTLNRDGEGVKEVFVTLGKSGADDKANSEAIGRLVSLYLQKGGDIRDVIKTLRGIQGESVGWDGSIQLSSVPDTVAKALEMVSGVTVPIGPRNQNCPDCGEKALVFENGCYRCTSCGHTKCQ